MSEQDLYESDDLRPEYDLSKMKMVRGKYHERLKGQMNLTVVLDPDVAVAFPTTEEVNDALRMLIKVSERRTDVAVAENEDGS